jgi:hypothetical protein
VVDISTLGVAIMFGHPTTSELRPGRLILLTSLQMAVP